MKEKLEKFEKERIIGYRQNKKLIITYITVMIFLAITIPLLIWLYSESIDKEVFIGVSGAGILSVGTLILFFVTAELNSRYEQNLRKSIIETVSNETFYSNVVFNEDVLSDIGNLHDYTKNNIFYNKKTKNELIGNYQDLQFKMFNLELSKEEEYYIRIPFSGQYLEFDLKNKNIKDLVLYRKKDSILKSDKRLKSYETGDFNFDEKYNFLTSDEKHYKELINEKFINKIFDLEKEYEGTFSFLIKDGKFIVLLSTKINFLKIDLDRSLIKGESYRKLNEELKYVKNIYDTFSEILKD